MSFRKKHLVGFGSILMIIIMLLVIIVVRINSARADLLEIVDDRYQKVSNVTEIQRSFYTLDRELLNAVENPTEENAELIRQNHIDIENNYRQLDNDVNTQKGNVLLAKFRANYDNYLKVDNLINELQKGSADRKGLLEEKEKLSQTVISTIAAFKNFQENMMDDALERANNKYDQMLYIIISSVIFTILFTLAVSLWVIRSSSRELNRISDTITNVDLTDTTSLPRIEVKIDDEIGRIAKAFNHMSASLEISSVKEQDFMNKIKDHNWMQTKVAEVAEMYQGIFKVEELAEEFIHKISMIMGASLGALYIKKDDEDNRLYKIASFADGGREVVTIGEGIVGQACEDKKMLVLNDIPEDYQVISTGLGDVKPKSIIISPVLYENKVIAVVELANMREFTELEQETFTQMLDSLGMALHSVKGRMEIERLLNESQAMTEELQVQAEELQTQSEELQMQSEELRMINEQLEERNQDAEQKSRELEQSKEELEVKNEQLIQSSKYKSEFLANMSHELRTPLNSILILSEMLATKEESQFTAEEKEFAKVINDSGKDLMSLINDILDLSKIEAGKLEIFFNEVNVCEIAESLERAFAPQAEHKGLRFSVTKEEDLPSIIYTDEQRMQQIMKNLLSNAVKFTDQGSVSLRLEKVKETREKEMLDSLIEADFWMKIVVTDTGLGISKENQNIIFEAFQQADGATARKYGGTGLGLSICREFSRLLGGYVDVESVEGEGSTFTVYLPSLPEGLPKEEKPDIMNEIQIPTEALEEVAVNKEVVTAGEEPEPYLLDVFQGKKVLITDDDHRNIFALKSALENQGVEIVVAKNGMECLETIQQVDDLDMILMDIMMPELDGYETMRHIRANPKFVSMPIIALTAKAMKGDREKCLEAGATDYISKPINLDQLFSVMRVWLTK